MATTVVERFQEHAGSINHQNGTNLTRAFQVHFDTQQGSSSALVAIVAVTSSTFAVDLGTAFPGRPKLVCLDKKASLFDPTDTLTWLVTCTYGSSRAAGSFTPVNSSQPKITYGSVNRQEVPTFCWGGALDADPAAIGYIHKSIQKNSANEVYLELPPIDRMNLLIRIDLKDNGSFNPNMISSHLNHLNDAAVTVADVYIPQWQGKITTFTAEKVEPESGTDYWIEHIEIEVAIDTPMYLSVLDAGPQDLVGGKLTAIPKANGTPWPLNGAGVHLSEPEKAAGASFHWWRFYHSVASDWSALNLPASN